MRFRIWDITEISFLTAFWKEKLGRRPKFKITAQNGSTTLLGLYGNDNEDEQQQEH